MVYNTVKDHGVHVQIVNENVNGIQRAFYIKEYLTQYYFAEKG